MPNVNYRGKPSQDPDLMTEEELSAAFEATWLDDKRFLIDILIELRLRRECNEDLAAESPPTPEEIRNHMALGMREEMKRRETAMLLWDGDPLAKRGEQILKTAAVMTPTSGVTSIPLGAPWPPLSREQVVKLHQALEDFMAVWISCGGRAGMDTQDVRQEVWCLAEILESMGIGRPAAKMSKRTWAHEGHEMIGRRHMRGMGVERREEPTQAELDREVQVVKEGLDLLMRAAKANQSLSQGQVEELLQSSADAPRRQEGQWEEPPKRNCWTCKNRGERQCLTLVARWTQTIANWLYSGVPVDERAFPPAERWRKTTDCPGWESKPSDAVLSLERWMKGGKL